MHCWLMACHAKRLDTVRLRCVTTQSGQTEMRLRHTILSMPGSVQQTRSWRRHYQWFVELMSLKNASAVIKGEASLDTLGVRAVDDATFEVTLSAQLPYFPQMTTHATTFPAPRAVIEKHGKSWTKPENIVSNGAYILTEHLPAERSIRERNPMYWDNDNTIIDKTISLVRSMMKMLH